MAVVNIQSHISHTYLHTYTHNTNTLSTQSLRCLPLCSLCTTYKQSWETCKFSVDRRGKGEGSDSISRCPELTFMLVLACNAIGPAASTIGQLQVTTLRLVLDVCLGTLIHTHTTCTCTHTQTHNHHHDIQEIKHTHTKQGPSLPGRT